MRWIVLGLILFAALCAVLAATVWYRYFRDAAPESLANDIEHFKYGSIGAEANGYPYAIWRELPTLFPNKFPLGWQSYGFTVEPDRPLPVGVSVRKYGVDRIGYNCATCHVSTVEGQNDILLGAPANKLALQSYVALLIETSADPSFTADAIFAAARKNGRALDMLDRIVYRWYVIPTLKSQLENTKAGLEWMKRRPPQGPGRTDAGNPWRARFGLHPENDELVGSVDMPSIWNQAIRANAWLHWDANNISLGERNLSAALAAGATEDSLDIPAIERVADWLRPLPPPLYPFAVDQERARQGKAVYVEQGCGRCHEPEGENYGLATTLEEVGTDPDRLAVFSDDLLRWFKTVGEGRPWAFSHYRRSDGYANVALDGIWARAPYLHNGSVPTLLDLLSPEAERPPSFKRGCDAFDGAKVGFVCVEGSVFEVTDRGNGNRGHLYGTSLSMDERLSLVEYLKTK